MPPVDRRRLAKKAARKAFADGKARGWPDDEVRKRRVACFVGGSVRCRRTRAARSVTTQSASAAKSTTWHNSPAEGSIVTYRGGSVGFAFLAVGVGFFAFLTILVAVDGNVAGTIFMTAFTALIFFALADKCRRVDLNRDGTVVLRYFMRRRLVAYVEDVYEIDRDPEDGDWLIHVRKRIVTLPTPPAARQHRAVPRTTVRVVRVGRFGAELENFRSGTGAQRERVHEWDSRRHRDASATLNDD
jgi:hypothetical protein